MSKFTDRFFEWQNYVHYLLNAIMLIGENYLYPLYNLSFWTMVFFTTVLILINDSLIHYMFSIFPKKIKWVD